MEHNIERPCGTISRTLNISHPQKGSSAPKEAEASADTYTLQPTIEACIITYTMLGGSLVLISIAE